MIKSIRGQEPIGSNMRKYPQFHMVNDTILKVSVEHHAAEQEDQDQGELPVAFVREAVVRHGPEKDAGQQGGQGQGIEIQDLVRDHPGHGLGGDDGQSRQSEEAGQGGLGLVFGPGLESGVDDDRRAAHAQAAAEHTGAKSGQHGQPLAEAPGFGPGQKLVAGEHDHDHAHADGQSLGGHLLEGVDPERDADHAGDQQCESTFEINALAQAEAQVDTDDYGQKDHQGDTGLDIQKETPEGAGR